MSRVRCSTNLKAGWVQAADCSGDLDGKPAKTVDCTVVAGPETASFTLTVTSVEGSTINFRYEPRP